jgi:cytochrome P450
VLGSLGNASQADLVEDFAYPMPVRVISAALGTPETRHGAFLRWTAAIAEFNGSPNRAVEHAKNAQNAVLALTDVFGTAVAERRRNKGSDLIRMLIDIKEEGEAFTEEDRRRSA